MLNILRVNRSDGPKGDEHCANVDAICVGCAELSGVTFQIREIL